MTDCFPGSRVLLFANSHDLFTVTKVNEATLAQPASYEEERGKPMPSFNHAVAQLNLGVELAKNRDLRTVSELTLELEGRDFTPDLSVYPRLRIDWRHDEIRRTDPPLTVVEIFSPTQGYQSIMEKVEVYFRNGVKSCWLLSPHLKTITILGADGKQWVFNEGIARDPYTGLSADVGAVFFMKARSRRWVWCSFSRRNQW